MAKYKRVTRNRVDQASDPAFLKYAAHVFNSVRHETSMVEHVALELCGKVGALENEIMIDDKSDLTESLVQVARYIVWYANIAGAKVINLHPGGYTNYMTALQACACALAGHASSKVYFKNRTGGGGLNAEFVGDRLSRMWGVLERISLKLLEEPWSAVLERNSVSNKKVGAVTL